MILNKRNTILLCLFLLILIVISVFSKEVLYETMDIANAISSLETASDYKGDTEGEQVSSVTRDVYLCIGRYNILLEAYKDSLNTINELRENPNMDNAFYVMPNSKIDIINTIDLRKSEECKRSYSYTDQYYFVNTAYEQHYLNWLNITILRNYGSRGCNVCSSLLAANLNNDESMGLKDGKAPRLWSLHHIGFYTATETDLSDNSIFDEYVLPDKNGIKKFYVDLERKTYGKNGQPVKIYFGVTKVANSYKAYVPKEYGMIGLNKLTQGCAISGTNNIKATILQAPNVYAAKGSPPEGLSDEMKKVSYIDTEYFNKITQGIYAGDNEKLSVFGFFNI